MQQPPHRKAKDPDLHHVQKKERQDRVENLQALRAGPGLQRLRQADQPLVVARMLRRRPPGSPRPQLDWRTSSGTSVEGVSRRVVGPAALARDHDPLPTAMVPRASAGAESIRRLRRTGAAVPELDRQAAYDLFGHRRNSAQVAITPEIRRPHHEHSPSRPAARAEVGRRLGASNRAGSVGATVWRNLRAGALPARVRRQPQARHARRRTARAPGGRPGPTRPISPCCARPPDTVPGLVAELGQLGTRAAIVMTRA
jgi:hypothetical protein